MQKLKLVALCLLSLSARSAWALTLSDIRTEVRVILRDNPTDTARRRYSDTTLNNYINEAQRDVLNLTWCLDNTTSYILSPQTTYYALPSDLIAIQQVYFTNRSIPLMELQEISQRKLYDQNPAWELNAGPPIQYWVSGGTATAQTALRIAYNPTPTRLSTGTVTIWYYVQVTDLSSDSDVPFYGQRELYPYHMTLAYQVAYRLKAVESKADEANIYLTLYTNSIAVMKQRLGQMPNYNPGASIGQK